MEESWWITSNRLTSSAYGHYEAKFTHTAVA